MERIILLKFTCEIQIMDLPFSLMTHEDDVVVVVKTTMKLK
jgi:hypothetical protein